jgi:hypothetical protein
MVVIMLTLTPEAKEWLSRRYPRLLVSDLKDRIVIRGVLDFNRTFDEMRIEDSYSISLILLKSGAPPTVRETAGRLQKVFDTHKERLLLKKIIDLHAYTGGKLCIMAPQEWEVNTELRQSIPKLFDEYIEPYFYSQSFLVQHGKWPWPHLPHGLSGIIAWFEENHLVFGALAATVKEVKELAEKPKSSASEMVARAKRRNSFIPQERCLCGKKKSYLMCHPCLTKLALALR